MSHYFLQDWWYKRNRCQENVNILQQIMQANHANAFVFAQNKQEQEELFSARKNAFMQ